MDPFCIIIGRRYWQIFMYCLCTVQVTYSQCKFCYNVQIATHELKSFQNLVATISKGSPNRVTGLWSLQNPCSPQLLAFPFVLPQMGNMSNAESLQQ